MYERTMRNPSRNPPAAFASHPVSLSSGVARTLNGHERSSRMQNVLLIALGGSLGAVARYGLATWIHGQTGTSFPWGTLIINLTGSFAIGFLAELFETSLASAEWRSFLTIGFLGAYTTFSTFSLESFHLLRGGEIRLAAANILLSVVVGLIAVVLGIYGFRLLSKIVH